MQQSAQTGRFSVLCTAKFRNLTAGQARGSQVFRFDRQGTVAQVVAQSPEWAAEIDTQAFVRAGEWVAVLHHQAHKSLHGHRAGVELVPFADFCRVPTERALLANRLPLPLEAELAFPSSLAYDAGADLLAVGINGREFKGAVYLYRGMAAGQPRLANRIDLHALAHQRPSALAFLAGQLWIASYSGGFVTVIGDPLAGATLTFRESGLEAPIGLYGHADRMYVATHLDHTLVSLPMRHRLDAATLALDHPWGLAGRRLGGAGLELLVANLNLGHQARSWVASCTVATGQAPIWQRLELQGGADVTGFSAIQFD
jgi:hypothetical protein